MTDRSSESDMSRISIAEFEEIARDRVPFVGQLGIVIERLDRGVVRLRVPYREDFVRPGGTIAGPVMMSLADLAVYGAVLSMIGPVELAVTTNLNINFLRRPLPGDVIAEARILKLGKRLAVGEVSLFRDGEDELVAHVTATYSIPPHRE
ncbi:MAG: PaaI family thioesterase [Acidiferrobacterales bacterium]